MTPTTKSITSPIFNKEMGDNSKVPLLPPSAISTYSSTYLPINAVDGDIKTFYASDHVTTDNYWKAEFAVKGSKV